MNTENDDVSEPDTGKTRLSKWFTFFLACFLSCGLYLHFFVNTASVEVELTVDQQTDFRIYWAGANQLYSEKNSAGVPVTPEQKHYSFLLTDIGKVARLRIDTHNYAGKATLRKLVIRQEGWEPITLATANDFAQLAPLNQIEEFGIVGEGLRVLSSGTDPNFEMIPTTKRVGLGLGWLLLRLVLICIIISAVVYCASPLASNLRLVPMLLFGIWMLIITMAGISKENSNPDEYVHMPAIAYYNDHWLPPVIDDPAIRSSYSAYGVSRLNNGEIYYLFAGKFEKFLQAFRIPKYLSMRLFNVCLFGLILLYTIRNRYARMVALPFLVSPQIWYVFSYCASDAFGLFFVFLASCELIDPNSLLHRYLKGDGRGAKLLGCVALGSLLGIVFLLKKNYVPFVIFFYLVLLAKMFFTEEFYWEKKKAILRLLLITCIGLSLFGLRVGADYMVNGLDREAKIVRIMDERAESWWKPNTELSKMHISLFRKARGITLEQTIMVDRWFEKTFQSAFGVYGYLSIFGTQIYYDLVRWSGVILLVFLFAAIFRGGGLIGSGLAIGALAIAAALIGAGLYISWTADFQPQGRYYFSLFSILGVLYGWNQAAIDRRLLILCLMPMFLLGAYSFIFDALMRIPRV